MKVLVYDLEITPTLGWTYGIYDTNVIHVEREPYIMCFSYKWLGEKEVKCVAQTDFPSRYKRNRYCDRLVVEELWRLLDEADVVVAHNAARFDNKVANERFLVHRLGPTSPYKTVDTLQVAKRYFRNGSNSLDNLCKKLELGQKSSVRHHDLWRACVDGDSESWQLMKDYCDKDVELLESLYLLLRPYIANHPNMALISDTLDGCPKCASTNIQYRGLQRSNVAVYRRVHCNNCGAWSRVRLAEGDKPTFVNVS